MSSEPCVSGTVHTGGACLSIGLGMMRDVLYEVHLPPTRLETEWGSGLEPSEDGSSVAQPGRADMQRRWPTLRRAAEVEEECRRMDSIMVHFYELNEPTYLITTITVNSEMKFQRGGSHNVR